MTARDWARRMLPICSLPSKFVRVEDKPGQ
jgi:hypothetical protein